MKSVEMISVAILYCSPLNIGGVETHLLSLLRHGCKSHYRWFVFSCTSPAFKAKAASFGAEVIPWTPAHAMDPLALISLMRLIRKHRISILHVHSSRAALFAQIASILTGIRVIVTVHQPLCAFSYEKGSLGDPRHWYCCYLVIAKLLNKVIDIMIHVSFRAYKEALDAGLAPPGRTVVIDNGIDLTRFEHCISPSAIRRALNIPPRTKVIACVARLHEQKGIDIFFQALKLLQPYNENIRVLLVGNGPLENLLRKQALEFGLDGIVKFLGFRNDVPDLLKASDFFVLPSRFECMSIGIMEAMAAGLSCVATNVGENARVIEHGVNGLIVPPEDPYSLSLAIQCLLLDSSLCRKMGRAAQKSVETYSDVEMVDRTLGVYAAIRLDIIGNKKSA